MARKAYRKWPDSTAGVRITGGAKRGISCVTYHDGRRHARRQERTVADSPAPESAHDDRRGPRERMRVQENETRDGEAMLAGVLASLEFSDPLQQIKGHLISAGERRPEATRPWPTFRPRPFRGQGQKAMTGRHASTTRQAWAVEMVRSVDGASWRKAEYSYRLEGVWGKSPMVRPLSYDRAWLTQNNMGPVQRVVSASRNYDRGSALSGSS